MGLISAILTLPLSPVRGLKAIAEIVREEVELQMQSPAAIQHDLEETERARAAGEISEEEEAEAEQQVLNRLIK
jgi:gas vesicle protein GvpG